MSARTKHREGRRYVAMARKSLASALYWLDRDDSAKAAEFLEESTKWGWLAVSQLRGTRPTTSNPDEDQEAHA